MPPVRPSGALFPARTVNRVDTRLNRPSRIVVALVLAVQFAAIGLAADARAAQLILSWTDNSSGATATRLERRPVDDPVYSLIADVPAGVTQYVDGGLGPNKTYCYRATAYDGVSMSDHSAEACGTTSPEQVLSVTVKKMGPGEVFSAPDGLACGSKCSATYPASTVVTLIPAPAAGAAFIGWIGGGPCVETDPCIVTGNTAVSATARFRHLGASGKNGGTKLVD